MTRRIRAPSRASPPAAGEPALIALIGPESSGKTTLAQALADTLPAIWVPERLREFCEALGRTPRADEQEGLMREQIGLERDALARARAGRQAYVLCDSTPLVTALYSLEFFGDASLFDRAVAHQREYALTIRTAIDIAWVADGIQRDGPEVRARFDALLARVLRDHGIAHTTVAGSLPDRVDRALAAIDALGDSCRHVRDRL